MAVEPSPAMRKLGKYLTEDVEKIVWFDTLARIVNVHDLDGLFDIVYCGYVLEEISDAECKEILFFLIF